MRVEQGDLSFQKCLPVSRFFFIFNWP